MKTSMTKTVAAMVTIATAAIVNNPSLSPWQKYSAVQARACEMEDRYQRTYEEAFNEKWEKTDPEYAEMLYEQAAIQEDIADELFLMAEELFEEYLNDSSYWD